MRLSGLGMGNGSNFGVENVLRGTQGGGVKITGNCSWTNNKQAFLVVRNKPVRGSNFTQGQIEGTYFVVTFVFAE